MKIFQKTFLYTLTLLILISLLASGLIYTLMPTYYTKHKQLELTSLADQLALQLSSASREDIISLMGSFAVHGQVNITIDIAGDRYGYITWDYAKNSINAISSHVTVISASSADANNSDKSLYKNESYKIDKDDLDSMQSDGADIIDSNILPALYHISNLPRTIATQRSFTMSGETGMLKISMTLAPVKEAAGVIVSMLPASILMCIIFAIIFSLLYARAITRPIKSISNATHNMTKLKRDARCRINSKDEFGELAANINYLYDNLQNTIASLEAELKKVTAMEKDKNDFLRAASHELKTPVTAVSVIMDNMILGIGKYKNHDEWLSKCKNLIDNLADKLRDILDASRLDDMSEPHETLSIDELCREVLEPYIIIAKARSLDIYIDFSASFTVTVPPKLLEKALSSIFSNAVLYSNPGGKFSVYCKGRSLIVENECTPIPEDQLSKIYEPFYRPDISRSRETGGNGLGLYIVKTILHRLELDFSFEPNSSPKGMRFTINF